MSVNTTLTIETIQRYIDIKIDELKENQNSTKFDNISNELLSNDTMSIINTNTFKENILKELKESIQNDSNSSINSEYFTIKKEFNNLVQLVQNNNTIIINIKKEFIEAKQSFDDYIKTFNEKTFEILKIQDEKIKVITSNINNLHTNIMNDINSIQNATKSNSTTIGSINEIVTSNNNDLQIMKKSTSEKFQDIIDQINELNQSLVHSFKIEEF